MQKQIQTSFAGIPEDWDVLKLGDERINNGIYYGVTAKATEKNTGIKMLRTTDIKNYSVDWNTIPFCEVTEKRSNLNKYYLKKGDLVVTRAGTVGVSILVDTNHDDTIFGSYLIKVKLKSKVYSKFIHYFFQSDIYWRHLTKAQGSTLKNINLPLLKSLQIPLPPLPEQKAIAEILSIVDEAIQKVDEIIAKTERLKKGLMQELFTKGIIFGFMFDTNIFDAILDNKISLNKIPSKFNYYVTHIQEDEIKAINKPEKLKRKKELFEIFKELKKEEKPTETFFLGTSSLGKAKLKKRPTESAVWDVSKWDNAKWGEGDLYNKLLLRLQELDRKSGKKKSKKNQIRDILIAETCIKNSLILITNDENLRTVTREFNGQSIIFEQFLKGEYKECKDSKIGKIPEDWKVVKLGKVAEYIKGKKPEEMTGEFKEGYLPYLSTEYLRSNGKTKFAKISKKIILANESDLILLWDGSNAGEFFIGKKGVLSSTMVKIRFRTEDVNRMFLFYLLKTRENYLSGQTRGTGIPHVDRNVLDSLRIPLPLFPEQKAITQILSTIDKKLELERKRKEKFERIKKSLMNDLLTGNKRMKFRG